MWKEGKLNRANRKHGVTRLASNFPRGPIVWLRMAGEGEGAARTSEHTPYHLTLAPLLGPALHLVPTCHFILSHFFAIPPQLPLGFTHILSLDLFLLI